MTDLLDRLHESPAFALLHRPESGAPGMLDVLLGEVTEVARLADLPLDDQAPAQGRPWHEVLAIIPFRQIRERGYACADDGVPLLAMKVTDQEVIPAAQALPRLPDRLISTTGGEFDVSDDQYAEIVHRVLKEAIGEGQGANFVIKRSFVTTIDDYTPAHALAFFSRLLAMESGAYWTFLVHTAERTFVGATPERHLTLRDGTATMNPISGTYRYPPTGPVLGDLMDFLADRKESEELYMVLDEELKMMTRFCAPGVRVAGPRLKEMSRLAHTEYYIEGTSDWDVRDILRESMFAPTVTGSPLENACRVINRYEPHSRGYYSGAMALIGRDASGSRTLDSAILIRTAEIDAGGETRIGVGATLVRHSDPMSEVAETRAKAAGLLAALAPGTGMRLGHHPDVRAALARRNSDISGFWLGYGSAEGRDLVGVRALIVDAEDTFTSMLDHQLRALGMAVTVRRYDDDPRLSGHDFIVLGPGPGDPRDLTHPKIAYLDRAVRELLGGQTPFLAVCLSHQVLCRVLGFALCRRAVPNQGAPRTIGLFGATECVGFYNTFAARSDAAARGDVELCLDPDNGEIHALRGAHFASIQFHAESVLTRNGPRILASLIRRAMTS
ncbi:anthranilate synthase family protein [Sinosporangium siamense]|uniref:anthranilate synthase n=1 Tax=Sinosporangium siamense TaxID=1367973 RepID=A0A919RC34_9ACTN|nr:anthranilate synthase family protein [Sinosporangium siamense]GII90035.1 phenazine-specific anthranilate synthase component I [Sinosporangium siamense]